MDDRTQRQRFSPGQEAAIDTRGMNVLVSAGAGSGKTSVLVERVTRCLSNPDMRDITSLLVVTFTDAAAAEMRERIADRIAALREQAQQDGDVALARHLARQSSLLDQAQISTLHSFCMEIVRRNFFVLGLEPTFQLLDTDASKILRSHLLQARMETALAEDAAGSFRRMLGRFGASDPTQLFNLVLRIDTFAHSQANPSGWLAAVATSFECVDGSLQDAIWMPPFRSMVMRKLRRTQGLCARGLRFAAGEAELQSYETAFRAALDALQPIEFTSSFDPFAAAPTIAAANGALGMRVSAKEHPAREAVKALRKEAQDLLRGLVDVMVRGEAAYVDDIALLAPDVACLMAFVEAFSKDYAEAKRSGGTLDFSDLEHLALTALNHPESGEALRLRERFQEIFVDEYQDISPIQDALVSAVTRAEGNLFVVGDVKQSIYRFRMAEPNLFLHQYETLGKEQPGRVIDLSTNYRSRREVVEMVNFVFQQLFQHDFGGIRYDEGARMDAGASYPETSDMLTEVHLIDGAGAEQSGGQDEDVPPSDEPLASGSTDSSMASSMETEATLMARRILELVGRAQSPAQTVFDRKRNTLRQLEYRDIVILLRSAKGRVETLVDVLTRAGIPVHATTSSGFYDALEIRFLTAALRALDNPRRDIDLAALLRSPLIGLDDEDLGWIRTCASGPYWDALQKAATATAEIPEVVVARAGRALARIQSWRLQSRTAPAATILQHIITSAAFLPYVLAMPGGMTRRANIERLLDDARVYDGLYYDGVFGFVKHLQRLAVQGVDSGEAKSLAETDNAVRVMTIHQSKGLEFPVVFVANLGKPFYQGTVEQSFPLHAQYGFGPQLFDSIHHRRWQTFPWIALTEANAIAFLAEEARVLYVAMTRARERLILVGTHKQLDRLTAKAAGWLMAQTEAIDADGLLTAASMLEWLVASLLRHPDAAPLRALGEEALLPLHRLAATPGTLAIQIWNQTPERLITPLPPSGADDAKMPATAAELHAWLEHLAIGGPEQKIAWHGDPQKLVGTEVPGKVSATELRRLWSARRDDGGGERRFGSAEKLLEDPLFVRTEASARREAGVAFHTVMQHLPFSASLSEASLINVIDSLHQRGVLDDRARSLVDIQDILGFLAHPLGAKLARATVMYREQPFFTRIPVADSFIAVQGVIDCLAQVDGEWLLVDYKTDHVTAAQAPDHAQEYLAQVATYLNVAKRLVGDAPVSAQLYFVKPQVAVPVAGLDIAKLFQV